MHFNLELNLILVKYGNRICFGDLCIVFRTGNGLPLMQDQQHQSCKQRNAEQNDGGPHYGHDHKESNDQPEASSDASPARVGMQFASLSQPQGNLTLDPKF